MADLDARIHLATIADFPLGGLLVQPSTCRVSSNGDETRIEPKVMEVLIVLARSSGRTVSRDELIDACWDGRAVSDDAVSRVVAKVRQLGRSASPPHFTLETLPKVGFRMEAANARAPASPDPTIAASVAPAAPQNSIVKFMNAWRLLMLLGFIALLASLFAGIWYAALRPGRTASGSTVEIGAFRTLHASPEMDRIAAYLPKALFRALTNAGLTAVLSDDGSTIPDDRGEFSLSGTVDRDGASYRLIISVTDRITGRVIWSRAFERGESDLSGIGGETAHDSAQTIRCVLRDRGKGPEKISNEVMALLFAACDGAESFERMESVVDLSRKLVAAAGHLPSAHAFRARALQWRAGKIDYLAAEAHELRKEARASANKALALDENSLSAHLAMNTVLRTTTEFAKREFHILRALAIDSGDPQALTSFAMFLRETGRIGAAREVLRRTETEAGSLVQAIFLSAMAGDKAETTRLQKLLAGIRPSWASSSAKAIWVFWEDPVAALAQLKQNQVEWSGPKAPCLEAYFLALVRRDKLASGGLPAACDNVEFDWRVRMLARLGNTEAVYEMLKQAMPNSRNTTLFLFYPEMKAVRDDPRFMPLGQRIGLLAYWRSSNNWPDFCSEPGLPYDCKAWTEK